MTKKFKVTVEFERETETEWQAVDGLHRLLNQVVSQDWVILKVEAQKQ